MVAVLLFLAFSFTCVSAQNVTTELTVPRDWQCGYGDVQRSMAYNVVKAQCPNGMLDVNYCCETHDICYNEQFGKTNCDDTFCHCLDVKTNVSCPHNATFGEMFCTLVRNFGDIAYRESANATDKIVNINMDVNLIVDGNTTSLSNKTVNAIVNVSDRSKRQVNEEEDLDHITSEKRSSS